jgi:lysophospholipase L1-like esterase
VRSERGKAAVFLFLSCAISLCLAEALCRVARSVEEDVSRAQSPDVESWMAYEPALGWVRSRGYKGPAGGAQREFDAAGFLTVDSQKIGERGRKKVVFLGDSNTFGFGVETPQTFVEVVERILGNVDAINLGVIGYTSYQGRVALDAALREIKPDLVVASFNFNDRRYVLRQESQDGPAEFDRVYRSARGGLARLATGLEISSLYRGLRRLMIATGMLPRPITEADVTKLAPRVDEDSYRSNLTYIARRSKELGVPVMFILLRDNPLQTDHLRRGIASLRERDYETAVAYLNSAVRSGQMFSDLARIYLAQAFEAEGDPTQAARAAKTSIESRSVTGGKVVRMDTDYNEIMRAVATENHVELIDGASVLEAHPAVFIDFCHFDAHGHSLLGELLARRIALQLGTVRSPSASITGAKAKEAGFRERSN